MFEQMLGPGLGVGLIDAILAQPDHLRLWMGWLVLVNLIAPAFFLPRTEAVVTILAFLTTGAIMSALFEAHGYSPVLGAAHIAVWPLLLIWLSSRWYGIDGVAMRLWVAALVVSNAASLILDFRDVALFLMR
jgi:hypothetical protein